jgi:subtilisin family serine protease
VYKRQRSNSLAQVLALDWQLAQQVHIVNISMGGPSDAVLAAAYRRATAQPVILLAAAGNGGPAAAPVFPAAYPGVLAITAIDALNQVYAGSNQGPHVSLAAPGVDLWVPLVGDVTGAGQYISGTSMATALASGMLARWGVPRLRQAHADRLSPICRAAADLGAPGKDPVFGCGRVR